MLGALLAFLLGCLVLCVVLYICHLVMKFITLPDEIKQITLCILGLIGLVVLIMLALRVLDLGVGAFRW